MDQPGAKPSLAHQPTSCGKSTKWRCVKIGATQHGCASFLASLSNIHPLTSPPKPQTGNDPGCGNELFWDSLKGNQSGDGALRGHSIQLIPCRSNGSQALHPTSRLQRFWDLPEDAAAQCQVPQRRRHQLPGHPVQRLHREERSTETDALVSITCIVCFVLQTSAATVSQASKSLLVGWISREVPVADLGKRKNQPEKAREGGPTHCRG